MPAETPKHFLGIEVLRFLCAFAVVISHYPAFFYEMPAVLPESFRREAQPFYALFFPFYDQGNFAVNVFWAISGFIFFWKYSEDVHARRVAGREFAIYRLSRLYPLHFATLAIALVLQLSHISTLGKFFVFPANDAYHFILNVFFISGWGFTKFFSFNAPIWSVSAEIFSYAMFFIVARFVQLNIRATVVVLVVTIGIYAFAVINRTLALCLMLFFVGGLTFHLSAWMASEKAKDRRWLATIILVAACAGLVMTLVGWKAMDSELPRNINLAVRNFVLVPSLIIVFVNGAGCLPLSRYAGAVAAFGNVTYSSYLVHFPLQAAAVLVTDHLGFTRALYYSPWAFFAFIGATFILAHIVYLRFEMPMQRWMRAALTERRPRPVTGQ